MGKQLRSCVCKNVANLPPTTNLPNTHQTPSASGKPQLPPSCDRSAQNPSTDLLETLLISKVVEEETSNQQDHPPNPAFSNLDVVLPTLHPNQCLR